MRRLRTVLVSLVLASWCAAQAPPLPVSGSAALELMLRKLESTATVMIVNAHPDDENNALIAYLAHGLGARVVELTLTRGEGGQNDLGFEQGLALSVLRTEELLSTHRIDGAEQLFARAIDFGYSFSVEETFAKWGKDEILGDVVHHIRAVRPDIIITMTPDGGGGGQHHQSSARIAREAFDKAADPNAFPEQIKQGLRPWQATRLYVPLGAPPAADELPASRRAESHPTSRPESGSAESAPASRGAESKPESRPGDVAIDLDKYDPALGCTYAEQGARARSMHKSQGMQRLLALPGPSVSRYRVAAGLVREPEKVPPGLPTSGPFIGIRTDLGMLEWRNGALQQALSNFNDVVRMWESTSQARVALAKGGPGAAVEVLMDGLNAVRAQQVALGSRRETDPRSFSIGRLLAVKEEQYLEAIAIAAGLRIEALADDGVVTPGQEVKVTVYAANRLAGGLEFGSIRFTGFDQAEGGCSTRPSAPLKPGGLVKCESKMRIPKDARPTSAHWKPVPGTCRSEFEPDVPFGAPFRPTPFRARVELAINGNGLSYDVPVEFRDASDVFTGEKRHELLVVAAEGPNAEYERIEYPHTHRRHLVNPTACKRPQFDLKLDAAKIGWIRGVGDHLDEAIECFGAAAEPVDEGVIKSGKLDRYPVIVIGSRALELRPEIRAASKRLKEYAEKGGTLIIFYQRSGLDEGTLAPYPGKPGDKRVTDENAPVKLLVPDHPAFNTPNKLGADDWAGWVQERGRSFFETKDARYVDLIEMEDPFEFNKGAKRGALVEARIGKGRWVYVALGLSRQLDDGVPGAYRLLANLLSLRGGAE